MNQFKKLALVAGVAALFSTGAHAFDVTATVSNTIALTETTPLTLGNVYITKGAGAGVQARLDLDPDTSATTEGVAGAEATTPSKFIGLGGAQAGVLSVSGAQAFGSLTVTHGALTALTHESGNPSIPTIAFTDLITNPIDGGTLTLDGTGSGQILVGGQFTVAAPAATGTYQDGVYTGTYAITVSY